MASFPPQIRGKRQPTPPSSGPVPGVPFKPTYGSNAVDIPDTFLTTLLPDTQPITVTPIDFANSVLPEYAPCYAVILDNVLSPSECSKLITLAEASVPNAQYGAESDPWQPALVNVGSGREVLHPKYRNSDRIIWDQQTIVDRLWQRIVAAEGIADKLAVVENDFQILGPSRKDTQRWEFLRVNERMRFLRYGAGQFFRPHCDGAYREPGEKPVKTIFTVHLYLNDSKQTVGDGAELEGGATSFLSMDEERKMDVDPKAGRVLIFQHRKLYHSGDDVKAGLKYTMRTDIMYAMVDTE